MLLLYIHSYPYDNYTYVVFYINNIYIAYWYNILNMKLKLYNY